MSDNHRLRYYIFLFSSPLAYQNLRHMVGVLDCTDETISRVLSDRSCDPRDGHLSWRRIAATPLRGPSRPPPCGGGWPPARRAAPPPRAGARLFAPAGGGGGEGPRAQGGGRLVARMSVAA